jgi:6-phosphogluconolactonase
MLVFIGTYTNGDSAGVYACQLDPKTGQLTPTGQTLSLQNPTFLATDPDRNLLFVASEIYTDAESSPSRVVSVQYDPKSGAMTELSRKASHGAACCHVSVTPDRKVVLAANYSSGNLATFEILSDGTLSDAVSVIQHEGSGPKPAQTGPHAHQMVSDPSGKFALCCDLGCDRVFVYRRDGATLSYASEESLASGAGPRHLTFGTDGRFVYVINEHDETITVFAWNEAKGELTNLQTVSTLPNDFTQTSYCADIHLSNDGRFLYGSNRGHDSLAIFSVDQASGLLTVISHQSTLGKTPRNFCVVPESNLILVANQDTHNIVAFSINNDGSLTATGAELSIPSPVCIAFG